MLTVLRVEMLGGFAIIMDGKRIIEGSKKSSKVWRLIEYLAANRKRAVPQDELLEVFCSEDGKGNPGSVVRTMVYRARTTLAEAGLHCASELIAAKSGCYSWNNSIECTMDIEELEEYSKKAASCSDDDEKLSLLLQVTKLYKGDFLQGSMGDMWAIPLVRYYRGLYIDAVHEALDLLMERGSIKEAEELSTKALGIDPFDEYSILSYLRTLLAQDRNMEALEVYKKMETMFYDELGVDFSEELHSLYKEIQHTGDAGDMPLQDVVMRWLADMSAEKAYCCDPSDFKMLCRIESLSAARSGHTTFIVRIKAKHDPMPRPGAKGGGVMKNLEQAIAENLRASDIYTRYSVNQFMIMLRSLTYEDCKMLTNKILSNIDSKYLPNIVDTSILHVTPDLCSQFNGN